MTFNQDAAVRAQDALSMALLTMAVEGDRPRCGDHATRDMWTSAFPDERALAATWCRGCAVLTLCGAVADANDERHGVWGGRDRSPARPGRAAAA